MKSTKFANLFFIIVIVTSIFLFSACGSDAEPEYCPFTPFFEDRNLLYGEVLTITKIRPRHPLTRERFFRAVGEFELHMQDYGISISLNFIDDDTPDLDVFTMQMNTKFMSSNVDTLIFLTEHGLFEGGIDWRNPSVSRFFADMWPIINADPAVNDEDFNMNIFDAMTLGDGSLRTVPQNVFTWNVKANLAIPGLADAFAQYDYVSMDDLQRLHAAYAEYLGYYMFLGYNIFDAISAHAVDFIDFTNNTADFNNSQFIDLLDQAKNRLNPSTNVDLFGWYIRGVAELATAQAETYAFMISNPLIRVHELLTFEGFEHLFAGPVPFTNSAGEILINPFNPIAISGSASHAQQVLAWEFMKFLVHPDRIQGDGRYLAYYGYGNSTFYRPFLQYAIYWNVARWYPQPDYAVDTDSFFQFRARGARIYQTGMRLVESHEEALSIVLDYHHMLTNMPMALRQPFQNAIVRAITNNVSLFEYGLLSAHEAAANIQNTVTLILLE